MLLPNASGAGSWSWRSNAAALGAEFQLFAIDLIGDAGKSEHHDLTNIMRTREDQAALYDDIMTFDRLFHLAERDRRRSVQVIAEENHVPIAYKLFTKSAQS
jgi:hypothetical protein